MEGKWLLALGALWLLMGAAILLIIVTDPPSVTITWQTETEYETAGFNILRSDQIDGEYVKINPKLIVSQGNPSIGGVYKFDDKTVKNENSYYYRLEEVELDNNSNLHEPLPIRAVGPPLWQPALAAFSIGIGFLLLAAGFRTKRKD